MRKIAFLALVLLIAATGCKKSGAPGSSAGSGEIKADPNVTLSGTPVTVAGLTFRPPSDWKDLGESGMRKGNYYYGPIEGDKDSATCAVFFFGQSGGGAVKDNIERWITQMTEPGGADPHTVAKQTDLTVDGMPAHWVELPGTYVGGNMMGSSEPLPNYRLAGAVVETPTGNVFFKLTGPEKTAAKMIDGFKTMLLDIKKATT